MRLPFVKFLFLFGLAVYLGISSPAYAKPTTILVMGDSLSAALGIERNEGWVHLLEAHLNQNGHPARVINAGVSGDTTSAGLARLPLALKEHRPNIVIIALGGNDGLRGLSLKEFASNLDKMVTLVKASGAKPLLCGVRIPPNLGMAYVARFIHTYREVADRHHVPLVQYILKNVDSKPELMQADGIHPTAKAQPIIMKNVLPALNPLL